MSFRNSIIQSLKITNQDDVNVYEDSIHQSIQSIAPLIVEGGMSVGKGIKIGLQENLIPGLMMYDGENFLGFSEKFGLTLLSNHPQSTYLEIPPNVFSKKIQSVNGNRGSGGNDLKETEGIKKMNIELEIKDVSKFYVKIPEIYVTSNFIFHFDIELITNENTYVSDVRFMFMNESNKKINFDILNVNMKIYYEKGFIKEVNGREMKELYIRKVSNQYLFISSIIFE